MAIIKNKSIHVVPSDNGWRVVRPSAHRASATSLTKSKAIETAKSIAKNDRGSVYIHRNDGRITSVENFSTRTKQSSFSKPKTNQGIANKVVTLKGANRKK